LCRQGHGRQMAPCQLRPPPPPSAPALRGKASAKATGHSANSGVARSNPHASVPYRANGSFEGGYAPHGPMRFASTTSPPFQGCRFEPPPGRERGSRSLNRARIARSPLPKRGTRPMNGRTAYDSQSQNFRMNQKYSSRPASREADLHGTTHGRRTSVGASRHAPTCPARRGRESPPGP